MNPMIRRFVPFLLFTLLLSLGIQGKRPAYKVIAFYTGKNDQAHVSFVKEANRWFSEISEKEHFTYQSTSNWDHMNADYLKDFQVVLFLDTRPEKESQRKAFEQYMKNGGGFIGFHFAAFALTPSMYPQNWDWYHNEFLGSGEYKGNTWKPTSAILKVEDSTHPATRHLPPTFKAQPNEWYSWHNDLRKNKDIKVLVSIDPGSFPLGTGPKEWEIWHSGDYPVVWTNTRYRMIYINMGHNDIDYEHGTNEELSFTFANPVQNKMITDALKWLGKR